jgi:LysR family hydrogen peroxide-inducible transcriptional activator
MTTILPTLRQLKFLVALADQGNFSRAAEATYVTQPTLSAGIKELEGILGTILVERGARETTLTPSGVTAVERARVILTETEELVHAARASGDLLSGAFRLGVIPTIAPFLLPRAVPHIRGEFPKLELFLREDQTHRLITMLKERRLDAALIALPFEMSGVDVEIIMDDEFLFACSSDDSLANPGPIKVDDVDAESLLLLDDGHCLRDQALAVCGTSLDSHQQSGFSATSLHTLVQMVRGGLGATLIPRLALDAGLVEGMDIAIRPFNPPISGREIGMIWRKGSARTEEASGLAQSIREAVRQK